MADAVDLVAEQLAPGHPEAIELRRCRERQAPVVDVVQTVDGVGHLTLVDVVPRAHDLVGVHAVGEVERGIDVQIVEERERAADRYLVLHAVLPVLDEVGVQQLFFFRRDGVGEMTRVAHGDFLIPALLACHVLALERIEARDGNVQVGHGERHGGIAHVLSQVERRRQRQADARERRAPAHRRRARRLCHRLRVVHRREVVALVAARGEVHVGRQRAVRIRLRILPMVPLHLETLLAREVGHALVAVTRVLIAEVELTAELIALAIVAGGTQAP